MFERAGLQHEGGHAGQVLLHRAVVLGDPGIGVLDQLAGGLVIRLQRIQLCLLAAEVIGGCAGPAGGEDRGHQQEGDRVLLHHGFR
jgi:hypothetical protein